MKFVNLAPCTHTVEHWWTSLSECVCRLSKQVLMNMTVCAMGSLSLSVNMQPCSSDSGLPRWVAWKSRGAWRSLGRHFRTLLILIGRAGHRAHTSVWGFQPPSFSWCTICISWPQPRGHAEWCMVSSLRKQNVLSNLPLTSSGVFDGENGCSYWFSFWGDVSVTWGGQWGRCRDIVRCVPGSSDLG